MIASPHSDYASTMLIRSIMALLFIITWYPTSTTTAWTINTPLTRRDAWRAAVVAVGTSSMVVAPAGAAPTKVDVATIRNDLAASRDKLQAIPELLEQKEWDKVRSILKLPPVNKLWNLGDVSTRMTFVVSDCTLV
jgi:hypothetical protein